VRLALAVLTVLVVVPAAGADPARLVLGKSIGAVYIGETEKNVVAAYGKAKLSRGSYGGKPWDLATYVVSGSPLQVYYDRTTRRVVGLSTPSNRYRTSAGFGVGSPASAVRALGFAWNAQCTLTYLKSGGGMFMEVTTRGHKRIAPVSEIYFIKAAYVGDC
jgi:hypothetical protein